MSVSFSGIKDIVQRVKSKKRSSELCYSLGNNSEELKKGFVLAGYLSLADSVAAFLQRRPDSTEKPNTFVRVGLEREA